MLKEAIRQPRETGLLGRAEHLEVTLPRRKKESVLAKGVYPITRGQSNPLLPDGLSEPDRQT